MKALTQDIDEVKAQKKFAWLITMVLIITGLPLLKNGIVFVLEKLYQMIIQRVIQR